MFDARAILGSLIDNRYRLVSVVGTGAFGTVYAADELAFGREVGRVAVKLLRPPNDAAREAIAREVRAMGQLTHSHLLAYRASGEVHDGLANGCLYIATELASGALSDRLDVPTPMAPEEVLLVARHLAAALAYLHSRHAIHRDVKPGNILRVGDAWKLGDFGLVRGLAGGVVQMSGRKGTVVYMSPEAMAGEGSPAGDVWSMGVVIQLCLAGTYPYSGNGEVEVITKAVTSEPVIVDDLPEPFRRVVRGCLVKDRVSRWSAERVADELGKVLSGPVAAPPVASRSVDLDAPGSSPSRHPRGLNTGAPSSITLRRHRETVNSVAFSPDGALVLTGGKEGAAWLWEAATGEAIRVVYLHGGPVRACAFSATGRLALTGGADRKARLWDIANGREICRFEGHGGEVNSVAFSLDGLLALTGSNDETARLWDVESGREIRRFAEHTGAVLAVALSPDGRLALSGGRDRSARSWVPATGRGARRLDGLGGWVRSVDISPDGVHGLICGGDATARMWNLETGGRACTFEGHEDAVMAVAFSPDGDTVLTAGRDHTARLWDASTAREIHRFEGHTGEVRSVAFSPNGHLVVTGSADGTARIWKVEG